MQIFNAFNVFINPVLSPAQKRTERRISVVSSAGTAKERVNMAKHRSRARGAAMYLFVFWVVFDLDKSEQSVDV